MQDVEDLKSALCSSPEKVRELKLGQAANLQPVALEALGTKT